MANSEISSLKGRRPLRAVRYLVRAVLLMVVTLAAACNPLPLLEQRAGSFVPGFEGGAAGDEPASVLVAQDILAAGGSAADAVVAAYFTMAVTLPSSASLGGGGACLVMDQEKKVSDALLFLDDGGDARRVPAPLNLRGMLALQGKYGTLPWRQLIVPGENAAHFGVRVSRALASDLQAVWGSVGAGSGLRRVFAGPDGRPLKEGALLRQPELAAMLERIRRDPLSLFQGTYASRLAAAYREAGAAVTVADIRASRPRWAKPVRVERRNQLAEFVPTPAGVTAAQMWAILYREGYWRSADKEDRPRVVAEAARRAFADAGRWFRNPAGLGGVRKDLLSDEHVEKLAEGIDSGRPGPLTREIRGRAVPEPADHASASIVAADKFGQAVACAFSMNGNMGLLRMAPGTGIVIAAPGDPARRGTAPLALMSLQLESQYQLEFMGAATGGAAAVTALNATALGAFLGFNSLEAALASPRVHDGADPDRVVVEEGKAGDAVARRLTRAGYRVVRAPALARVNALSCPAGFEGPTSSRCEIRTDRRGFGFARQN